jgi:MFS family permease
VHSFLERNRFLLAFATLSSLMGVSIGLAKTATSLYSLELGADETMLGFISGAQMVGILIMGLPVGFWVDRVGPTPLFLTGSVLAGLVYVAIPWVPTAEFLLLCTAVISFFMPLRFISLNTIFMRQLEVIGESKAGWYRGSHMMGMFFIGPVMAPPLIGRFHFEGVFYLIGFIFVLTILLSPIVLKSYGRKSPEAQTGQTGLGSRLILLYAHPELREVSLIEFFCHGMNMFYSFFIVVIAINDLYLDTASATGLVAVQGMAYVFALFCMGGFTARCGRKAAYLGCFGVISISLAVLGYATTLPLLWTGSILLGLSSGTLEVVNLTRFARIGSEIGRGKAAAVNALAGPSGALVASLVGGPLGSYLGLKTVFILFIPAWLILALLLLRAAPAERPKVRPFRYAVGYWRRHRFRLAALSVVLIPSLVIALHPELLETAGAPLRAEIGRLTSHLFIQGALEDWLEKLLGFR